MDNVIYHKSTFSAKSYAGKNLRISGSETFAIRQKTKYTVKKLLWYGKNDILSYKSIKTFEICTRAKHDWPFCPTQSQILRAHVLF